MFDYIIKAIIPIIIILIVTYGMIKGVKVYECFIEGAKEGLNICLRIFPYLLAMLIAINVFRASGAMDFLISIVKPGVDKIGVPAEVVPLVLMKPLSGSGAIGIFTDIINQHGSDNFIGICASIIMGSTETIFYTLAVYFGAVQIKKIRHTLWVALLVDMCAVLIAVNVARILI
ncbi:spore maturation protein [Clostridium sp. ATCC 25772]|uniref:spore maturation protein n=1 Tax=Clostridium sp. ATCC 25772 TaxID=1676991 RepID=UPI0007832E4E|nr:spore maturation protein [Clostridium sp. ATCC 25772]